MSSNRILSESAVVKQRDWPSRWSRWAAMQLSIIGLLTLSACGGKQERPAPPTYPVTGKVVASDGRSLAGGCVEFRPSQNEDELIATGVIDKDNRFSLSIPFVDRVIPGAVEGKHRANVILPLGSARDGGGSLLIAKLFTVQPSTNEFTIELPAK